MTGPVRERVTAVLADGRQGSGYLLTPYLVLTAGHVVRGAADIRAAGPGGPGEVPCGVLWPLRNDDLDIALLVTREDLVPAAGFPPMLWARTETLSPVPGCQAIGFPAVQRGPGGRLDTEQLTGTFKPGSGLLGRNPVLAADGTPPAPRRDGGSPWAGMSGAAVFSDGLLLGVITGDPAGWQHGRVTVVPAVRLLDDRRFMGALLGADCPQPVPVPLTRSPDTEFEARYADHIAKKHGKLTIYGLDLVNSPSRWPLDAAYLSLETTVRQPCPRSSPEFPAYGFPELANAPTDRLVPDDSPRPADRALADHERVLLRGVAGSGKTTLVQWLAVTAARQAPDDRVPFVLPLRTLTRHGERLPAPRDFLAAVGSPLAGSQPDGWEHRVLTSGRGLLLVDGIDEVPEPERERTRDWLRDLVDAFPGNRWLVTSRPSAVREDWLDEDGFVELTLSPMSPADVTAFVKRWHTAARAEADDGAELAAYEERLLTAIRTKPDLGRLATNPLMCGLICALHRDRRGYLPPGRKELYNAALSMLLVRRDRERSITVPVLNEEPQLQLLQRLAYWLIKNGRTEMDRSRAEKIIADALPAVPEAAALGDAAGVYRHFLHRSGLLREPAPGTVDFIHRTFQDFLGARAAVDDGDFGLLAEHAADDQWEDVIRMAVAHARPRERTEIFRDLLARGDAAQDDAIRARVHLLATACLEHAAELAPAIRAEVERRTAALIPPTTPEEARALAAVGPLVLDLLPGPAELDDVDTATAVVTAASHVDSDRAIPFLARFAQHESVPVRSQVVWAWHRFDCERYAEEVMARLSLNDLDITIQSEEEIRQLRRLGIRPTRLDIRGDPPTDALARYVSGLRLIRAIVRNSSTTDISYLADQPHLTYLSFADCTGLTDLSPLGALPVETVAVRNTREDATVPDLSPFPRLRTIEIVTPPEAEWSLRLCPDPKAPERNVSLLGACRPAGGFRHISGLSQLTSLLLGSRSSPASGDDWAHLQRLPRLLELSLCTDDGIDQCPYSTVLPTVTRAFLFTARQGLAGAVPRVPRLFPNLTILQLLPSADEEVDLSPLAAMSGLRRLVIDHPRESLRGLDRLPPSVTVHTEQEPEVYAPTSPDPAIPPAVPPCPPPGSGRI